jgi:hypothetical protein
MFLLAFFKAPETRISEKLGLPRRVRIRCPKCNWEPAPADRWSCNPGGCGNIWNTFETRGVCPECSREWKQTACLRCSAWSLHDEWYVEEDD